MVEIFEILIIRKFERIQYLRSSHSLSRAQFSIKILHRRYYFFLLTQYLPIYRGLWNSDNIWENSISSFIHYPERNSLLKFFFQKKLFFFWLNIFQYIEVSEILIIWKFEWRWKVKGGEKGRRNYRRAKVSRASANRSQESNCDGIGFT